MICVLVPSLENSFFTALIAALERSARSEGYDIVIASSNDDETIERARMAALLSWKPAGIVVVPSTDQFAPRDLLNFSGVPYVTVDRVTDDHGGDAVTVDNKAAAALAARHLIRLGHRDTLVVASSLELANIRERCAGIAEIYRVAGLNAPEVLEIGMSFEEIGERIERCLRRRGRPSGVVALTNFATMGVIAAFKRLEVVVPDDVSLIGFDDYTWMQVSTPSITAVVQPIEGMAAAAWQRLRARIGGADHAATRVRLDCRLEVRHSTKSVGPSLFPVERPDADARREAWFV